MAKPAARRKSIGVDVGGVMVGGGAPIVVQSMTNTDTADIGATVAQVAALHRAGSEIVRVTVDRSEAAAAVPFIVEKLAAQGIVVREGRAGETMTTLDGERRKLETSDLLICSGDEPVALAGIMGGEASRVEGDTSQLLLEVASFDAGTVRRTSARLGLRTDASARFEKTLSPTLPLEAAGHVLRLLQSLQPDVQLSAPASDAGEWSDPSSELTLRPGRVRALLGCEVSDDQIRGILERLSFKVTVEGESMRVRVPSERAQKDVTIEQDLVEEVGRIWRYGNVPERCLTAEISPPPHDARRALVRALEDRLAGGARFHQTISYSFHSDDLLRRVGLSDTSHVEVQNPVAEGVSRVRRSVIPSLLELLATKSI